MLGLRVHRPVQRELHVGGLHLAAVGEPHVSPQEERVILVVAGVPALGQPRHHLAVAIDLDEALLHVVEDHRRDGGGGVRRHVEPGRLRRHLDHQAVRGLRGRGDGCGHERGEQDGEGERSRQARHQSVLPVPGPARHHDFLPVKKSTVRRSPSSKSTRGS